MHFLFSVVTLLIFSFVISDQNLNHNKVFNNLVYVKNGNVSIKGIFNGRIGNECEIEVGKGLQEIAAAIWTVEALNHYNFLPGLTIGLSVFETCSIKANSQKELPNFMELNISSEEDGLTIGTLTTLNLEKHLESSREESRTVVIEHMVAIDTLVDMVVELLTNLQWLAVDMVISDSDIILNSFSEKTSAEGICVRDELLINRRNSSEEIKKENSERKDSSLIVIFADFAHISVLSKEIKNETIKLIWIPTDFFFLPISDLPKDTIILLPSMNDKTTLSNFIKNAEHQKDFLNHKEPTKSPLFIDVASSILKLLKPFKEVQEKQCRDKQPCAEVLAVNGTASLPKNLKAKSDDIAYTLKALKIDARPNDDMFLYIASLPDASADVAIFQVVDAATKSVSPTVLMVDDDLINLRGSEKKVGYNIDLEEQSSVIKLRQRLVGRSIGNHKKADDKDSPPPKGINHGNVTDCDLRRNFTDIYAECPNFARNKTKPFLKGDASRNNSFIVWRFQTWVSINTSVGCIGTICTLTIMLFIFSRICSGDILEGSPYFTLLLMVSVVFLFVSSLVFHLHSLPYPFPNIRDIRLTLPAVAYAIVFSLLFSRSLMLASSETGEGFVNHINGYIQSVLCFFVLAVQASFSAQLWIYPNLKSTLSSYGKHRILITLSYNFLLLTLLSFTTPFIIRSKRNYKEGLLFSITIFFVIVVWSAWISFYYLMPEYEDAAIAIGLNSTATVLLVCIFIPRTYLMVAAIVRDRTARSLPPLDRNILSQGSDINYTSNQALNESVFGTITYKSPESGLSNPNFYSGRPNGSTRGNPIERFGESVMEVTTGSITSQGM